MKIVLIIAAVLAALGLGAAAFVYSGLYDISATDQHLPPTFHAIRKTMERSVERRAKDIVAPPLGSPAQLERGLAIFRAHCVQCHGAPGVAPEPFALALRPLPTPLVRSGRDREPAYLYWVVRNGIKMTAMPSWEMRMADEDLWAVVAFMRKLPSLSPREYEALEAPRLEHADIAPTGEPDAARGKRALLQYACVACHEIPGVTGAEVRVGPPLHGIGSRQTLGGVLPNTPENMALWLRAPRDHAPGSAMPNLGISTRDARDMAAYLATLR
jgi:mono/diheme cytochrome c family protein